MTEQALNTEVSTPSAPTHDAPASEPKSRRERLREAKNGEGSGIRRALGDASKSDKVPRGSIDAEEAPKPWEAPAYAKVWSEQRRKALEAIATREDMKDHWKEVNDSFTEHHDFINKRNGEIGFFRKAFDGVPPQLVDQMRRQYQLQGMSLENGLGQLWGISQQLAQNPDATLAWLAGQFRPRDANKFLQNVAQALGADLGQIAQGQPYVDPVVSRELQATRQQLQQLQNQSWQQQNAFRQQQYNALVSHITEFEQAKDASGALKHPYATEVGQDMGLLLQTGRAKSLEEAYEIATKLHPKAQEDRAKAAQKKALEDAARNTTDAERATSAARSVNSKPNGRENARKSMMDSILAAEKKVYGKTR